CRVLNMTCVSTNMRCAPSAMAMPLISVRVVCTLGVTIETLAPTSALMSVDLPTLGAPISATNPQRCSTCSTCAGSAIAARWLDALAREHRGGGSLFGGAFGPAQPFSRRVGRKLHSHPEFRIVIRPRPGDLTIGGRR